MPFHKKKPPARDTTRTVGIEGVGSPGDIRDRFRDVYKPGARVDTTKIGNPIEQVPRWLKDLFKKKSSPSTRSSK